MTDGKVDQAWAAEAAKDLIEVGEPAGHVTGMGEHHQGVREGAGKEGQTAVNVKEFEKIMKDLGVPAAGMEYAIGDLS